MCCNFLQESAMQRQGWALERMQRYALPKPGEVDAERDEKWREAKVAFERADDEYRRLCEACCR